MHDDTIATALDEFGRAHHLPPLAWAILHESRRVAIQGFGGEANIRLWVDALELNGARARTGKHRWSGELGEWRVDLLAA
ncbi:hypothetical protein [Frondihabitans cladoniiphilus]|uniref:Uncharacterized protein n=1 Tax=Frondihabitans cladoniiphilus TaxID=715785 RepID=A0ABP8VTC7_9MICO